MIGNPCAGSNRPQEGRGGQACSPGLIIKGGSPDKPSVPEPVRIRPAWLQAQIINDSMVKGVLSCNNAGVGRLGEAGANTLYPPAKGRPLKQLLKMRQCF